MAISSRDIGEDVATITTVNSDNDQVRPRLGQQKNSGLRIFLHRHGHVVDFICSFSLVCLCLIILLPQVHDSFLRSAEHGNDQIDSFVANDSNTLESLPIVEEHNQSNHHHHNHGFPAGEFLVCLGFFVFYCVGFSLEGRPIDNEYEHGVIPDQSSRRRTIHRRQSTTCCSSTKCPPVQSNNNQQQAQMIKSNWKISSSGRVIDELTMLAPSITHTETNEDCLMLLNAHHQHHTHSKHHDIAHIRFPTCTRNGGTGPAFYGSIAENDGRKRLHMDNASDPDGIVKKYVRVSSKPDTKIIVDEIRIISETADSQVPLSWPRSLKMLIISMILAAFLVFLDIRIHGMLVVIKVFRACSTGALLYVAFFIMLPRDRVGCNSCQDEES